MKHSLPLTFLALAFMMSATTLLAQPPMERDGRSGRGSYGDRGERGSFRSRGEGGGRGENSGMRGPRGDSPFGGPGMRGAYGGGPPFGGGGPPFAGGPPFGGGGPFGNSSSPEFIDRMMGMLKSMDANKDGKLDQSEIPEYRRNFVNGIISRLGGNPGSAVNLSQLERRAKSGTGSTTAKKAGTAAEDPLVPAFGEPAPAETPVLAFGQREAKKAEPEKKPYTEQKSAGVDRIQQAARELMNKFDKNKNGYLDKDKGEWAKSLPFDANAADKNRDGRVSMSEMIAALGGKIDATSGYIGVSFKPSVPYDRLPAGVPDWFIARDKDQDGQLTMQEYGNEQPWTKEVAAEFQYLDRNNDGVVTIAECFAVLKEYDEAKQRKADAEQREKERLRGGAPVPTSPSTPTATTQSATPNQAPAAQSAPSPDASSPAPAQPGPPPSPQAGAFSQGEKTQAEATPPQNAPYSAGTEKNKSSSGTDRTRTGRRQRH